MNKLTGALLKTGGNREKQNMLWNMAGSFCYAFASMVLAFLVMGIIGDEEGGIFSLRTGPGSIPSGNIYTTGI